MKPFVFCLAAVLISQPAMATTSRDETRIGGLISGEAICSLARHGASKEVLREELLRITKKLTEAEVVDLRQFAVDYFTMIDGIMRECPSRQLPDG